MFSSFFKSATKEKQSHISSSDICNSREEKVGSITTNEDEYNITNEKNVSPSNLGTTDEVPGKDNSVEGRLKKDLYSWMDSSELYNGIQTVNDLAKKSSLSDIINDLSKESGVMFEDPAYESMQSEEVMEEKLVSPQELNDFKELKPELTKEVIYRDDIATNDFNQSKQRVR